MVGCVRGNFYIHFYACASRQEADKVLRVLFLLGGAKNMSANFAESTAVFGDEIFKNGVIFFTSKLSITSARKGSFVETILSA